MAKKTKNALIMSDESQRRLVIYLRSILAAKQKFSQFTDKLTAIDVAYACYSAPKTTGSELTPDQVVPTANVTIPIIASQVDTVHAYLADTFLSGYPLFPVASGPDNRPLAEAMEALLDFHSLKGKYLRNLSLILKDAAKYDFCAVESIWGSIPALNPLLLSPDAPASENKLSLTKLKRLDPYNTIWDYRVSPAEVADLGEYSGYIELFSRNRLKRLLNELSYSDSHMNVVEAMNAGIDNKGVVSSAEGSIYSSLYYTQHPQVSDFIDSQTYQTGGTWEDWLNENPSGTKSVFPNYANMYEVSTIYARIIPADYDLATPRRNSPQIWKFQLVGANILISASPVVSAHDQLPVVVGQPIEDGLSYQTRSIAESHMPFQKSASDLYNVRVASSKRSINDRMLYDDTMIDPADINSPVPAAKIPVRNIAMGKTLRDAATQIPFDSRGTDSVLSDMQQTIEMSYMLQGLNPFRQGQTVKGNRSVAEFNSIINFSDLRTRLLALMLEVQIFTPIKDTLKLNLMIHETELTGTNHRTGAKISIDPQELRTANFEFKLADGYNPRSKILATDDLSAALQFIAQTPALAGQYDIGELFAHLLSLKGVKHVDEYLYSTDETQAILAKAMPIIQRMQAQSQTPTSPAPGQ